MGWRDGVVSRIVLALLPQLSVESRSSCCLVRKWKRPARAREREMGVLVSGHVEGGGVLGFAAFLPQHAISYLWAARGRYRTTVEEEVCCHLALWHPVPRGGEEERAWVLLWDGMRALSFGKLGPLPTQ